MGEGNADLHFLEAYRRVEIFLRDAYGGIGGEGVERYLEQMRKSGMPTARRGEARMRTCGIGGNCAMNLCMCGRGFVQKKMLRRWMNSMPNCSARRIL